MKRFRLILLTFACCFIASCTIQEAYPDKGRRGNVEVRVQPLMDGETPLHPRVFLDDKYIGNASMEKPILYLRRGTYRIRVELHGYTNWEERIRVLGPPSMQIVNANLIKVKKCA